MHHAFVLYKLTFLFLLTRVVILLYMIDGFNCLKTLDLYELKSYLGGVKRRDKREERESAHHRTTKLLLIHQKKKILIPILSFCLKTNLSKLLI